MFPGFKKNNSKKSIPKQLKTPLKPVKPAGKVAVKEHVSGPFNIRRTIHAMIDPDRGLVVCFCYPRYSNRNLRKFV